MAATLLEVQHVTKRFGGFQALTDVSLQVPQGECLGLIGPNGSGKTTLINCISGVLRTDGGSIRFHDKDITTLPAHRRTRLGIARSFQIPKPFMSMTVLENLCIPLAYTAPMQDRGTDMTAEALAILQRIGLEAKANMRSALAYAQRVFPIEIQCWPPSVDFHTPPYAIETKMVSGKCESFAYANCVVRPPSSTRPRPFTDG